jgi:hypothetical protein
MRGKFRAGDGPDQGWLMPPDPRDWLPAGHLAWKVLEQAGKMDLSAFTAAYRADGQGGRPYHPAMMVALLLTGNNDRMEGSGQPPRAAWPLGWCLAWGNTVSAGDSSGSSG